MTLTIQDLGALGELVGGAAVIITLIYLAFQMRQNTLAIKVASYGAHAATLSRFLHNTAMDEGLSDIMLTCQRAKQYGDASVDEKHWPRFSLAMRSVFVIHEDLYYQQEHGLIDHSYWDHRIQFLAQLIASSPVTGEWWQREKAAVVYVPGFIDAIDNVEITIPGEYLHKEHVLGLS